MLAATIASSVVQPVFGHLFDTRRGEWLLVAGPALAGLGIGALAFVHSFELALLCVLVSSIGVAGFHPRGEQVRGLAVGLRRSTAMSVFSVGGNLGVALGPLLGGVIASHTASRASGCWRSRARRGLRATGRARGARRCHGACARRHRARRARPLERDDPAARRARGARLRALRPDHVHPAARARARHNSRAYGSRVLALMLFAGVLGTLLGRPARRPLRPAARCSR